MFRLGHESQVCRGSRIAPRPCVEYGRPGAARNTDGAGKAQCSLDIASYLYRLSSMGSPTSGNRAISFQSAKVLNAFINDPSRELAGADLIIGAQVPSGTLYPILLRFEDAGWLKSRWETGDPSVKGRPLRRLYRITGAGLAKAAEIRKEFLGGLVT
jgi:PadR family transcriptional regulator PadR